RGDQCEWPSSQAPDDQNGRSGSRADARRGRIVRHPSRNHGFKYQKNDPEKLKRPCAYRLVANLEFVGSSQRNSDNPANSLGYRHLRAWGFCPLCSETPPKPRMTSVAGLADHLAAVRTHLL